MDVITIYHAYSGASSTIYDYYKKEMRAEWDNLGNNFYIATGKIWMHFVVG
jgi:hypothetical protein